MAKKQARQLKVKRPAIQTLKRLSKEYRRVATQPAGTVLNDADRRIWDHPGDLAWGVGDLIPYVEVLEDFRREAMYMADQWRGISADESDICNFCGADDYGKDTAHTKGCPVLVIKALEQKLRMR